MRTIEELLADAKAAAEGAKQALGDVGNEASGDQINAAVVEALKHARGGSRFVGEGASEGLPKMLAEGSISAGRRPGK